MVYQMNLQDWDLGILKNLLKKLFFLNDKIAAVAGGRCGQLSDC
jgi:hypothetical protein